MKVHYPALLTLCALLIAMQTRATLPASSAPKAAQEPTRTVVLAQTSAAAVPNDAFASQFEKVWQTVRDHLYDRKMNGKDWEHIGETYRARLPEIKTREAFEALVNQMLEELHVSHTEYYTNDDIEYYMLPSVMHGDLEGNQVEQIGIMGHREGADYVVTGVMDGSPAAISGILDGDHLLSADGQPFTSAGSFRGKADTPVEITLRREGEATTRTVRVTPVKDNVLHAFLTATRKSARVIEVNGLRLGYVHLWTMAHMAFRDALENLALGKLHNTDGLILDLRDGYGGFPWGFGDVFYRPDIAWQEWSHGVEPHVRYTGYARPMVVLINGGTRSAKESFTYQFKTSHRAIIVGSRTAGAFLGAGSYKIGSDGLLELAVLGLRLDGNRLEGVGVTPDVAVPPAFSYTAQDTQLARAEQVLADAIHRQPPTHSNQQNVVAP